MSQVELAYPENELKLGKIGENPFTKYAFRVWSRNAIGLGPKPSCMVIMTEYIYQY